jgi:hypothetical protein
VQSFSSKPKWRSGFDAFCKLLDANVDGDGIAPGSTPGQGRLFVGWCTGDQRFRDVDLRVAN